MLDVNRLRAAGAGYNVRPRVTLEPNLSELRRLFNDAYDHACAVQEGTESPYGHLPSGRPSHGLLSGHSAATAPFCGECGAIRSATGDCRACGSTLPPDLRRMNPRARSIIS
jgi:hypothetical protein